MDSSSKKELPFRSPSLMERDSGVMCSATQDGLRVRRSKALERGRVLISSAIGPGKPYWKRPTGSTGAEAAGVRA